MAAAQGGHAQTISAITAATTTYVDCAVVPSTSFTANKRYIIFGTMLVECNSASVNLLARLVHGTTPTEFTDAFCTIDVQGGGSGWEIQWMVMFDQPATAEEVKLQIANAATSTTTCHMSEISWMKLSDDFVENTDYFWAEVTADLAVADTPYQDGASVTFTPPNGTDDWWVAAQWAQKGGSTTGRTMARINRNDVDLFPECAISTDDVTADQKNQMLSRVYVPAASSQTFKLQFALLGTTTDSTVFSSRIFVLNLSKFQQHFATYTEGLVAIGTSGLFVAAATGSINPTVTGPWFYMGSFIDISAADDSGRTMNLALRDDDGGSEASDPAYGDGEPGVWPLVGTEEAVFSMFKLKNLTTGATRTVRFGGATSFDVSAKHRQMVGFSLELAPPAVPEPPKRHRRSFIPQARASVR